MDQDQIDLVSMMLPSMKDHLFKLIRQEEQIMDFLSLFPSDTSAFDIQDLHRIIDNETSA